VRIIIAALVTFGLLVGVAGARSLDAPVAHAAAVCSDYPNQAAAQRAADTRDADGDGIYCESLPCPCSTGATASPTPTPTANPTLGTAVALHKVAKTSGCRVRGPLPDPACTPGARYSKVTKANVCVPGYSKRVRNVPQSVKDAVYRAYGITKHFNGTTGEVDHLVSLELGGANEAGNDPASNLFPEAASPKPGSHEKDKLENLLHSRVCDGTMTLRAAQTAIAKDWLAEYHKLGLG
jgi:hypothetical protein